MADLGKLVYWILVLVISLKQNIIDCIRDVEGEYQIITCTVNIENVNFYVYKAQPPPSPTFISSNQKTCLVIKFSPGLWTILSMKRKQKFKVIPALISTGLSIALWMSVRETW